MIGFLALAEGQGTRNPMLGAIWTARKINELLGGAFVGPWDVDELPGEWIDAIIGMGTRVPRMAEGKKKVEAVLDAWRSRTIKRLR
jgi:hypothetical protein